MTVFHPNLRSNENGILEIEGQSVLDLVAEHGMMRVSLRSPCARRKKPWQAGRTFATSRRAASS